MIIGLDIHGVIDRYRPFFSDLSHLWIREGHEVHIITGQEFESVSHKLDGISYTHFFSIVEYHQEQGTHMWNDDPRGDGWWLEAEIWNRTKGLYADRIGLDIHFDDSRRYSLHFPKTCNYVMVMDNFDETWRTVHGRLTDV